MKDYRSNLGEPPFSKSRSRNDSMKKKWSEQCPVFGKKNQPRLADEKKAVGHLHSSDEGKDNKTLLSEGR